MDFFSDYSFYTLFFLAAFAFIAGFLDAIVGGGGLTIARFIDSVSSIGIAYTFWNQ